VEAHLVSLARGHIYFRAEFLSKVGALQELRAALPGILDASGVHESIVTGRDGRPFAGDVSPDDSAAYRKAIWTAARRCLQRAGARPVVFLLAGGRQRTTTAYPATTFQLLARSQDHLIDVRVSDPRVEGGTSFFFPEQSRRFSASGKKLLTRSAST
jgi:CRISPR-associated protein (TIGR02584 family)